MDELSAFINLFLSCMQKRTETIVCLLSRLRTHESDQLKKPWDSSIRTNRTIPKAKLQEKTSHIHLAYCQSTSWQNRPPVVFRPGVSDPGNSPPAIVGNYALIGQVPASQCWTTAAGWVTQTCDKVEHGNVTDGGVDLSLLRFICLHQLKLHVHPDMSYSIRVCRKHERT